MILRFSLENWMSFRERSTLNMIATRERQHSDRIARIDPYSIRLLPIAVLYGGNASGKTNLFRALKFAKSLVVKGTQPGGLIAVEEFRLHTANAGMPTRFDLEILVEGVVYEFSFSVTRQKVLEEKLVQITRAKEQVLYHRHNDEIEFSSSLKNDQLLKFAFQGTRENQLFLTNTVSQNVSRFFPIYAWFRDQLVLIAPDSRFEPFESYIDENSPMYDAMNHFLRRLDTGIDALGSEVVPFEHLPIPEDLKSALQDTIKEGMPVRVVLSPNKEMYVITRKGGELMAKKLVTFHLREDGSQEKFEIRHESDGTQRVIDLLPAFLDLISPGSEKVYVIDEVDRSIHPLLARQMLESYLSSCISTSRKQLLMTTHNVQLMDQKLLRRDELWITERETNGETSLASFSEFKDVRYDKDIRKSYLQGRLGGVPHLQVYG